MAVPIYMSTAYEFRDSEHASNLFALKELGNIYTRLMNPTNAVFEKRFAQVEGGIAAIATASGMSAIFSTIINLCEAGDNIIVASAVYGGTSTLTGHTINDALRVLLHSLFHWNIEYLPKLYPVSKRDRTFVKKAKPLFFVWEEDIIKEVEKNEIPYISEKCPLSKKAKTKEMDEIINKIIEIKGKQFLETFLKGFLKKRKIFKNEFVLNECKVCGSLTPGKVCSFCKLFNLNKPINLKH
jgi:hypothetical protein